MARISKHSKLRSKRVYKKRKLAPSLKKQVKAIIRGQEETKDFEGGLTSSTTQPANTPISTQILYGIGQGTNDHQRVGDEITPVGFKIRFTVYTNVDSGLAIVILLKSKVQPTLNATSLAYTDIFKNITGNIVLDDTDSEKMSIVKMWRINTRTNFSGQNMRYDRRAYVRFPKTKFKYDGDNSGYGKTWTYHLAYVCADIGTNNVGFSAQYTVFYKDS